MRIRLTRTAPLVAVAGLFACALAFHLHTALGAEQQPDAVVRASVEAAGAVYAGDCATTVAPRDIGAVCSRFIAEEDGTRAYLTGRTFSEFDTWLFVDRGEDGVWQVVGREPLDFHALSQDVPWPN
ncbi:MAG: hypothetical protein ACRDJE_04975 [Dehalococcoidia bacterium]